MTDAPQKLSIHDQQAIAVVIDKLTKHMTQRQQAYVVAHAMNQDLFPPSWSYTPDNPEWAACKVALDCKAAPIIDGHAVDAVWLEASHTKFLPFVMGNVVSSLSRCAGRSHDVNNWFVKHPEKFDALVVLMFAVDTDEPTVTFMTLLAQRR